MTANLTARALAIRQCMQGFIDQRFEQRTEKLEPGSEKFEKERQSHEFLTWLEAAVRRSNSLQIVTHPLKASYPDAHITKADSLFCLPETLSDHELVATGSLKSIFHTDVTGNAAALDVYRFLMQEFEGQHLLHLCIAADGDMQAALHPDPEIGREWLRALANVTQPKTAQATSHGMAKQIYWCFGDDPYDDDSFVILQPLFSSAVTHHVYLQIQEDRFGEAAKRAREARRRNEPGDDALRIYPNLAVQNIGGSNPQNISYLNSARRGTNYLLSSCPPLWQAADLKPILFQESAFRRFSWKGSGRWGWDAHYWLDALKEFLSTEPDPVMRTRLRIRKLMTGLIDELLVFMHIHHELPAGWTASAECRLPLAQKCWLDPKRVTTDKEFAKQWHLINWEEEVEESFAQWVNYELGQKIKFLGDVEYHRWSRELRRDSLWRFTTGAPADMLTEV